MTSYVGLFVQIHHADGTPEDIALQVQKALTGVFKAEPGYPLDVSMDIEVDESAGARPAGTQAPNMATPR